MSRQLALDTLWLRPTPRLAHTEYSVEYHQDYITRVTGLPEGHPDRINRLRELWGYDFLWSVDDGLHGNWFQFGRATDMGHAEYAADGSDLHQPTESPFHTVEEVWAFDPVAEYGLPAFVEQAEAYERAIQAARQSAPDQLMTGGYYKTCVSGAIQAFGWDMFLLAAADRGKIAKVLERILEFTRFHMNAWVETSVEAIIQHDDFVWTEGAFMHPTLYRDVIIPGFAELWKPLKAAGKKIIFCSDGNFMEFAEDIVAAGADGLSFEPCNEFGWMVERFGDSTVLIGSDVDCRDLAFGTWDKVRATMDRTLELSKACKGLIWAVGNHMPANIPGEMMDRYIEYLQANWWR